MVEIQIDENADYEISSAVKTYVPVTRELEEL